MLSKFGLQIVSGDYGAGKTKNTFKSVIYQQHFDKGLFFANIPYSQVHSVFQTTRDLNLIILRIIEYINGTNELTLTNKLKYLDIPNIYFIVDEAHLYYFSRNFASGTIGKNVLIALTQIRKRYINFYYITQNIAQLDVFFRRLCNYYLYYETFTPFVTIKHIFFQKSNDSSDVGDEFSFESISRSIEIHREKIFGRFFSTKKEKILKPFYEQRYLTDYVVSDVHQYELTHQGYYYQYGDSLELGNNKNLQRSESNRKDSIDFLTFENYDAYYYFFIPLLYKYEGSKTKRKNEKINFTFESSFKLSFFYSFKKKIIIFFGLCDIFKKTNKKNVGLNKFSFNYLDYKVLGRGEKSNLLLLKKFISTYSKK